MKKFFITVPEDSTKRERIITALNEVFAGHNNWNYKFVDVTSKLPTFYSDRMTVQITQEDGSDPSDDDIMFVDSDWRRQVKQRWPDFFE